MSEARDVIARALASVGAFDSEGEATVVDLALHAAGYRIAGPEDRVIGKGELDPVTLEMAAAIADKRAHMAPQVSHEAAVALLIALPDAIRNLGRKA